jgi:aryl-alcohol dehydrogenase-like predicted oxidoreductase
MMMKANGFSEKMGWGKFVATQNYYSIAGREIEREILPMAICEGISVLSQPGITSVIIGTKNCNQLHDNINAVNLVLGEGELMELNKVSEIDLEYPVCTVNRQLQGRFPG